MRPPPPVFDGPSSVESACLRPLPTTPAPSVSLGDSAYAGVTGTRWVVSEGPLLEGNQNGNPVAARFGAFAAGLPHPVWAIRFALPLSTEMPLDEAVEHFVAHAVVVDANDAFARLEGRQHAAEVIGKPLADVTPFTASQRLMVRRFLSEGYRLDQDLLTLEGDSFAVTQQGYVQDGHLALVWGISATTTQHSSIWEAEVEQLRAQLAGMGRDVHDGLGQLLTGIRLLADTLASLPSGEEVPALATRIAALAQRAQAEAQALGRSLSAAVPLGFEFRRSLEDLCEVATATGVACHVTMDDVPRLPPIVHLHLFRIAQEAVSNALRHAHARRIDLRFGPTAQGVALVVEDDGVGLAHPSPESDYGVGMANMRARAEALRGDFYVEVRPEGGTRVYCGVAPGGIV